MYDEDNIYKCEHKNFDLVKVEVTGGAIQIRKQCNDCWRIFGNAIAKAAIKVDIDSIEFADFERQDQYERKRLEALDRQRQERRDELQRRQEERAEKLESMKEEYQRYLLTDRWRKKRALVLKRANYVCEGCGEREANEVHHLTYDHIGTSCEEGEFLFELLAVCSECHRRIHGK